MLKFIGSATLLTFAINEMLGEETDVRYFVNGRRNSNFMRIRVFGRDWSLFGPWGSIVGLIITAGTGKPHEAVRQTGSALITNAWDFITGETAVGERVRDTKEQVALRLMENFIPFSADELPSQGRKTLEGIASGDPGEVSSSLAAILGESLGVTSGELTPAEIARRTQQEAINRLGLKSSETGSSRLEDLQREDPQKIASQVNKEPDVVAAREKARTRALERGSEIAAYLDEQRKIRESTRERISALAESDGPIVADNGIAIRSGEGFRFALPGHMREQAILLRDAERDNAEAVKQLDAFDNQESQFRSAREEYVDQLFDDKLEDPNTFDYNFAERERRLQALRAKWGTVFDEVEQSFRENEHPMVVELRRDREFLKPYFQIKRNIVTSLGLTRVWEQYLELSNVERGRFLVENPGLEFAFNRAEQERVAFRENEANAEAEKLLFKWSYVTTLRNPIAAAERRITEGQNRGERALSRQTALAP